MKGISTVRNCVLGGILVLMCFETSQAQFLKKLGKKIKETVEAPQTDTLTNGASDTKGFEKIFSGAFGKSTKKPRANYQFDYLYQLEMETPQGKLPLNFYLSPGADYTAMIMNRKDMEIFNIIDYGRQAMFSFIGTQGQKIGRVTDLDAVDADDQLDNQYDPSDYTITDLPSKTILGYNCIGKQMENDRHKVQVYYTKAIDINMENLFYANSKQSKNREVTAWQNNLPEIKNGLILEMIAIDKNNNETMAMTCTKLEKVSRNFTTEGYQLF